MAKPGRGQCARGRVNSNIYMYIHVMYIYVYLSIYLSIYLYIYRYIVTSGAKARAERARPG